MDGGITIVVLVDLLEKGLARFEGLLIIPIISETLPQMNLAE